MDRFLKPERLNIDPNATTSEKHWKPWFQTFRNFLVSLDSKEPDRLCLLVNYVSPEIFELIATCSIFDEAIETLEQFYVKPINEIFARHLLATRSQESSESLDIFLQSLKQLSLDCNFKDSTALECRENSIGDAFISGLSSHAIRQRLLENNSLDLKTTFDTARSLEMAQKQSESYNTLGPSTVASIYQPSSENLIQPSVAAVSSANKNNNNKCYFCGNSRHPRSKCPAKDATCNDCSKKDIKIEICIINIGIYD